MNKHIWKEKSGENLQPNMAGFHNKLLKFWQSNREEYKQLVDKFAENFVFLANEENQHFLLEGRSKSCQLQIAEDRSKKLWQTWEPESKKDNQLRIGESFVLKEHESSISEQEAKQNQSQKW